MLKNKIKIYLLKRIPCNFITRNANLKKCGRGHICHGTVQIRSIDRPDKIEVIYISPSILYKILYIIYKINKITRVYLETHLIHSLFSFGRVPWIDIVYLRSSAQCALHIFDALPTLTKTQSIEYICIVPKQVKIDQVYHRLL